MATQSAKTANSADDLDAIRKDIDALRGDLATLVKHLKQTGRSKLDEASAASAEKLDELRDDLESSLADLQRQGKQSIDQVEQTIRDKPLMTLLAAFGAGVLIARLLDRR